MQLKRIIHEKCEYCGTEFERLYAEGLDMQSLVDKIIKILKDHVRQNNQEINLNQEDIGRILGLVRPDQREKDDLEYKRSLNHELLNENDDFIGLQLQLTEFMEKYGHLIPDITDEEDFADEEGKGENVMPYFHQTIVGQLEFGPGHPQYHNPRFFNELLKYYQDQEDYEKCDQLIKLKRGINKF